jgi:hypothetical protein
MRFLCAVVFFVGAILIIGGMAELFGGAGAAIGIGAVLCVLAVQGWPESKK